MKKTIFQGCGTAIATPFTEDGVNFEEFGKLIEFQIENGVDAIIVCGTTGESATMTKEEREKTIKFAIDAVAKRTKVVVGTGSNSTKAAVEMSKFAEEAGADAILLLGEGGVLSALWKMAEASGVGLGADLRKIPIRQETIEICERFDLNPYYLRSEGALLLGIAGGERLVQEYRRRGIPAAVIGQTVKGNDRLLYSGENARYLDRPAPDEILKMNWQF